MASLVGDPKRNPSARWLLICFYVLLAIGGATMVYPFWLMLKGSISGSLDFKDRALVPRYLYDRDELFLKFLTQRYPDTQTQLLFHIYPVAGVVRPSDYRGHIQAPQVTPPAALLQDWQQFIRAAASPAYLTIADPDRMTLRYQAFLQKKFSEPLTKRMEPGLWQSLTPIERLNRVYHQMEQTFTFVSLPLWKFGQSTNQDASRSMSTMRNFSGPFQRKISSRLAALRSGKRGSMITEKNQSRSRQQVRRIGWTRDHGKVSTKANRLISGRRTAR